MEKQILKPVPNDWIAKIYTNKFVQENLPVASDGYSVIRIVQPNVAVHRDMLINAEKIGDIDDGDWYSGKIALENVVGTIEEVDALGWFRKDGRFMFNFIVICANDARRTFFPNLPSMYTGHDSVERNNG